MRSSFLAIDFETANYAADSACAIGLVRVRDNEIIAEQHCLIKPPSRHFMFTHIHGLAYEHVASALNFGELWPQISSFFDDIEFVVAHNVSFDRNVLHACCARYQIELPDYRYKCTVQMARKHLGIFPTNLPAVCKRLGIELKHHDAMSDALACAKIAIAAHAKANDRPSLQV